ncbi:hypothetical protein DFH29DRAFT_873968 [Suillus ampliporus]|nr:hypothetical protein DFH29DRAFT_873968 [Suillus ampliporus]
MRFFFLAAAAALTASMSVSATPSIFNRDTPKCREISEKCTANDQCCSEFCAMILGCATFKLNFEKDSQDAEEPACHERVLQRPLVVRVNTCLAKSRHATQQDNDDDAILHVPFKYLPH